MPEMKPIPPTVESEPKKEEPKPAPPKEDEKPKTLHSGKEGLFYK